MRRWTEMDAGREKELAAIDGRAPVSVSTAAMAHQLARAAFAPISGQGGFAFGWWRWAPSRWCG